MRKAKGNGGQAKEPITASLPKDSLIATFWFSTLSKSEQELDRL